MGLPYHISLFEISLLITFVICLLRWAYTNKMYLGNTKITICLFAVTVIPILSLFWTRNASLSSIYIIYSLESLVAYIIMVNLLKNLTIKEIMTLFTTTSLTLVLGSVLSYLKIPGFVPDAKALGIDPTMEIVYITTYYARLSHPFFGLSNNFAAVLSLFLLPIYAFYISERKSVYLIGAALTFAAILATLSRGVLIPVIMSILIINFIISLRNIKDFLRTSYIIPLAMLPVIIYTTRDSLVNKYLTDRLEGQTFNERIELMRIALNDIISRPLIGVGAGVQIRGLENLNSHNSYLDQLVYYGIPLGIVLILCIIFISFQFSIKKSSNKNITVSIILSLICQYLIFASQSTFESNLKSALFIAIAFYISIYNKLIIYRA